MLASLNEEDRIKELSKLSTEEQAALRWHWPFWARQDQLPPDGDWTTWLIMAGRGWGKTRTGAETIRNWVCGSTPLGPGKFKRIALVAETGADGRDVMVEGESGLLAIHPPEFRPTYYPSKRRIEWPNGALATLYNATEPDQLRGPQHDAAWADELAKWKYVQETWDQLQFGLRLGEAPKQIITTTPRPLPILRRMLVDPTVTITKGHTEHNHDNLAEPFLKQIYDRYGGTRLGEQELKGEILDDIPGALWQRENINLNRREVPEYLDKIIVAVDPAASSQEGADENGIVVVGMAVDGDGYARGYVLEDGSLRGTPEEWARRAIHLYREWEADYIVAEKNQGGEMVSHTLRSVDRSAKVKLVHAAKGKHVRAEPVSALYEQNRIHHCGEFDLLEDQMCLFSIDNLRDANTGSPDRVDALVWGFTELFEKLTGRRRKINKATGEVEQKRSTWSPHSNGNPNMWMA